jgi:hypothetical protein
MGRSRLRLLGTDVLLVAMGTGRPNNALFVVECDGAIATDALRAALSELLPILPWLDARLERGWPWGYLRWRVGDHPTPPPIEEVVLGPRDTLADSLTRLLNRALDPRREPPLRMTVIKAPVNSTLIVTWSHPLMDPRGVELFVAMLLAAAAGDHTWLAARTIVPEPESRPLRERLNLARNGLQHLHALTKPPCRSLARGVTGLGRVRYRQASLPADTGPASTRTMPTRLALVGRAMTRLWAQRQLPLDEPFLVPISVDRRRKGEPGPVFCNNVAFHFARFTPASTADVTAAAANIRRGMAEAVRDGAIEGLCTGTDLFCWQPPGRVMAPFRGGDLASFNCADTGPVRPALAEFFGARVRNAYHVPCVASSPGVGVFLNRCNDTENVVVVWIEPVLRDDEVETLLADITTALGTNTPAGSATA